MAIGGLLRPITEVARDLRIAPEHLETVRSR